MHLPCSEEQHTTMLERLFLDLIFVSMTKGKLQAQLIHSGAELVVLASASF